MGATYYVDGVSGADGNAGTSFGAAWQTLSHAASTVADGDTVVICNTGTYTLTTTVTWTTAGTAANGGVTVVGGDSSGNILGPTGTPPTITSSTNGVALFSLNACSFFKFRYLKFTHTAGTRGDAFACVTSSPGQIYLRGIVVDGCANGFNGASRDASGVEIFDCYIANCTSSGVVNGTTLTPPFSGMVLRDTTIYNCTSHGVYTNGNSATVLMERCIIAKNGGKGIYDPGTTRNIVFMIHDSIIVDNTGDGIRSDESTGSFTLYGSNNLIWGNGGYGVNITTQTTTNSDARCSWRANFYGSNTSGNLNGISSDSSDVTGINDPFTSRAGQDWSINNTAGAGALVRASGYPSTFRGTSTPNYMDGGAAQHADPASSGTPVRVVIQNIGTY